MEVLIDGQRYVLEAPITNLARDKTLGAILAAYREGATWDSLESAAAKVGISKTYLWELEHDKAAAPSFWIVVRLAKLYGVSLDVLAQSTREDCNP